MGCPASTRCRLHATFLTSPTASGAGARRAGDMPGEGRAVGVLPSAMGRPRSFSSFALILAVAALNLTCTASPVDIAVLKAKVEAISKLQPVAEAAVRVSGREESKTRESGNESAVMRRERDAPMQTRLFAWGAAEPIPKRHTRSYKVAVADGHGDTNKLGGCALRSRQRRTITRSHQTCLSVFRPRS
jgi:hypothetical protein